MAEASLSLSLSLSRSRSLESVQLLGEAAAICLFSSRLLQISWATMKRAALMVWFWTGPQGWLAYFHPVYRQQPPPHPPSLLFLLHPLFHPLTHPCVWFLGRDKELHPLSVCVLVRWGALRLRESFLLFIWGVPPGDALGMTFVESLTPTHTHTHTHTHTLWRTSAHTYTPFTPAFFQAAHWLWCWLLCNTDYACTDTHTQTHTHVTPRPPSLFTVGERSRGSPFSTLN